MLSEKNFAEFFSLLASKDGMKAVIFTQSSTETSQYTADMMAKKIGRTVERFLATEPNRILKPNKTSRGDYKEYDKGL